MKLSNAQIREAHKAHVFLSKVELECFVPICMNVISLEDKATKVEDFLVKIAEKQGYLNEEKTQIFFKTIEDAKKFDEITADYMKKTSEVDIEIINRKQLEGSGAKIPADLIVSLVKMKIIV